MVEITASKFSLGQLVRFKAQPSPVYRIYAGYWKDDEGCWYYKFRGVDKPEFKGCFTEEFLEAADE